VAAKEKLLRKGGGRMSNEQAPISSRAFLRFKGNPPLGTPRQTRAALLYRQKKNYGFALAALLDLQFNLTQLTAMIVSQSMFYCHLQILPLFSNSN
jgi:hypothetical protein